MVLAVASHLAIGGAQAAALATHTNADVTAAVTVEIS